MSVLNDEDKHALYAAEFDPRSRHFACLRCVSKVTRNKIRFASCCADFPADGEAWERGPMVNVSTIVADYGACGMRPYGSSKAAIKLLTKAWAPEHGPSGVRINAVSPGPTRTEGMDAMGQALEQLAARRPSGSR